MATAADPVDPSSTPGFDYRPTCRVVFGEGAIDQLGDLTRSLGGTRALIVTDAGLRRVGHVDRAADALTRAGVVVAIDDRVHENPTTKDVGECVEAARKERIDVFVGLGGGSSMDTAKGANFLLTNGGKMADYWGVGKATKPMLPLIAIPTTAGTGSEAQSFALIADETTHVKMACGDPKAMAKVAILDPVLTLTLPASVTAIVGIDALSHALESYVTRRRNPLSQLFADRAWRLLNAGFEEVLRHPTDLSARGRMLLGAHWAGTAIENSMLGAAHAAANPLTARFGVTHGIAVGVMLPAVLRYNAQVVDNEYQSLSPGPTDEAAGARLAQRIRQLLRQASLPTSLQELDVPQAALPELAQLASQQWTAQHNPRPIDAAGFLDLYQQVYSKR